LFWPGDPSLPIGSAPFPLGTPLFLSDHAATYESTLHPVSFTIAAVVLTVKAFKEQVQKGLFVGSFGRFMALFERKSFVFEVIITDLRMVIFD
jgi:hypothetical protein